jgi:DNA-binding ferritin-like protein
MENIQQTTHIFESLLINLLESYNLARIWHLQTNSHAEHKALESYYESIEDVFDSLAEQYQGTMGNDYRIQYLRSIDLVSLETIDLVTYFENLLQDVEEVAKLIRPIELFSHITALLDDAKSIISKTAYLLSFSKP